MKHGEILGGHEWNQIKIDEEWANCDLTWDYIRVREGKIPKFCLISSEEFNKTHRFFDIQGELDGTNKEHYCPRSFDAKVIQEKLQNIDYADLSTFSFDATSGKRISKKDFEKSFVDSIRKNPNFSHNVLNALKIENNRETEREKNE